jgi:hypothetical protein
MGRWRAAWESGGYRRPLDAMPSDWRCVRRLIERGAVRRVTVRSAAIIDGDAYPVIGHVHRDTLDWTGHVVDKLPIDGRTYNQAMTDAIEDIKTRWATYRVEFERRRR